MSERGADDGVGGCLFMMVIFAVVGILIAYQLAKIDTLQWEVRDLQRRVGQLESER